MSAANTNATLTTAEAAALLGITPSQVRYLCSGGKLTATKHGRDWQIQRNATFDAYASRETRQQGRGRPRKDRTK